MNEVTIMSKRLEIVYDPTTLEIAWITDLDKVPEEHRAVFDPASGMIKIETMGDIPDEVNNVTAVGWKLSPDLKEIEVIHDLDLPLPSPKEIVQRLKTLEDKVKDLEVKEVLP